VGAVTLTTVLAAAIPASAATVFLDDFSDGVADGWTMSSGTWAVAAEDGNLAFQQSDGAADARAIANNVGRGTTLGTVTTARAKLRSTGGSVAVLFNALDANNYAFAALRAGRLEVGRRQNGALTVLASAAYTPAPASWQTFNILGGSGNQTQVIVTGTSPGVLVNAPIAPVGGSNPARKVGVATIGALASFDNIRIEDDLPPIDTQPPTAPGLPVVRNITSNGFTMSWPASTDNVGVVGYDVTTVVPPGVGAPIRIWRTSSNSITITDLPTRSQNTFEVRAFDAVGNRSAPSPRVVVTTLPPDDQTPPTAPGTPVVSAVTSSGFTLSWAPSTDNAAVTAYYVRTPDGTVAYGAFTTTTATLTGLAANTAYTVVVVAADAGGNISPPSGSVTITTLPAGTCQVSYRIVSQWSGGFQAEVTIRNTSTAAIGGWTLQWTFRNGETITSIWNVSDVTVSGSTVTVRDAGWNGTIPSGGSISFGFTGTGVPVSPAFVLNGAACVTA
jgi:chitodextrinase